MTKPWAILTREASTAVLRECGYEGKAKKMATVKSYDSRCYELAKIFLAEEEDLNHEKAINSLALEIQQCIEDEIHFMREGMFNPE